MVYFKKIAKKGKYHDDQAIPDLINYITRPEKTPSNLIYGVKVDMDKIANSMVEVSEKYKKNSRLRLHHFVITFESVLWDELELIVEIARNVCNHIGKIYQIAAAVHEDTEHPHIHFVFNSVSHINGYKYHGGKEDYYELIDDVSEILSEHDLYPLVAVKYKPNKYDPNE